MIRFRFFLASATILIYLITVIAAVNHGVNWPAVAMEDLAAMNWRTQFDTDFLIYLFLGAIWISWREGFTPRGHLFGFLSVFFGGMFSFPYLLYATYESKGDLKVILLGLNHQHEMPDRPIDR